jgi:hypothetical protein
MRISHLSITFFSIKLPVLKGNILRPTIPFVLPRSALTPKPTKIPFPLNALHARRTAFDLMTLSADRIEENALQIFAALRE